VTLSEADTYAQLIDPAIHARGWSEDHICREVTPFKQARAAQDGSFTVSSDRSMIVLHGAVALTIIPRF
jgi:type I site-specific restriction endonuclease